MSLILHFINLMLSVHDNELFVSLYKTYLLIQIFYSSILVLADFFIYDQIKKCMYRSILKHIGCVTIDQQFLSDGLTVYTDMQLSLQTIHM